MRRRLLRVLSKRAHFLVPGACLVCLAIQFRTLTSSGKIAWSAPAESSLELVSAQAEPGSLLSLLVWAKDPAQFQGKTSVKVTVADAAGVVAEKWLHAADLDFYLTVAPRRSGRVTATLTAPGSGHPPVVAADLRPIPIEAGAAPPAISSAPNDTWESAQTVEWGRTIFGSADERPYAPSPTEDAYAALLKGFQWFKFTFHGAEPRLAFITLDVTDRDVPMDVDVFRQGKDAAGRPDVEPYTDGQFVYQIEATQNYPGLYKFRTRILHPGQTYYLRVAANHPAYRLRMRDYPIPPYQDPRQAVRTGMDFIVNMGDTWLSNTPRRGAVALRTSMVHAETSLCIACHPTQFSTRAYVTAIDNGYAPLERPALEFLTDRIANNARPLYGEPGANWVRVIYSARAVSSRLPLIEHLFQANVTHGAPLLGFDEAYGSFLKVHYRDRKEMPGNETDGCEPDISPFEIATQSWQTFDLLYRETGDPQWLASRDEVERLAVPYEAKNVIDLNWKITFLATLGREKYKKELDAVIAKLYSLQFSDGQWPYHFDKKEKPADFITYHAIYALATAGRRPETDPNLARALDYCMKAQRREGSWEGDPVYQGFNTPFRATEFAVMGLSQLYPGPITKPHGQRGWDDGFPAPPTKLATGDTPRLLEQLDQFWDLAPEPVLEQVRRILETSPLPLEREAAARALGHMADPGAVTVLAKALGDPSKLVQTSAAWALRQVLVRRPQAAHDGRARLEAAVRSADARTRWGATRLFNQHFKYLTDDAGLLEGLKACLADPVPMVRFQAAKALWQWYYWRVDQRDERQSILAALTARMSAETDPIARRGLHESIYNVLDENTGYLGAWVRTASTQRDKDAIIGGYEDVVRDQAQVLARALETATPSGREGILESLWDFHVRHMALPQLKEGQVAVALPAVFVKYVAGVPDLDRPGYEYPPYREAADFHYDVRNGFFQTRVGNDSDLIHFFSSSGPELEGALIDCLKGADSSMKINVLKAGSALSGAGDERFALAALRLSLDPDPAVRKTVQYVYENGQRGILNFTDRGAPAAAGADGAEDRSADLRSAGAPEADLVRTTVEILERGTPEAQAVLMPILASLPSGSPWTQQEEVAGALKALLERDPRPGNYAQVMTAAASFDALMSDQGLERRVLEGVRDPDPAVARAAIQVVLERFLGQSPMLPRVEEAFGALSSAGRAILIEEAGDPKFMRRHAGFAGGAVSQDQSYLLGADYAAKDADFVNHPAIVQSLIASLSDPDANVRAAALDALRKTREIEKRADFRAAIARLREDTNPRLRLIASSVLEGRTVGEALKDVKPAEVLDFNYFVSRIEPILAKPGSDGKACVMCHASHVVFRLQPPDEGGAFSPRASEENYKYALRVVDISNPERSLILIKPTRPSEGVANVADYFATHNGGQRWPGNESSTEFKTILQWVRGARLETAKR